MSSSQPPALACPVGMGSPIATSGPRYPLYSPEYAADPQAAYRWMREKFGPLVPVDLAPGVPATLVIGYHAARRILHDPDHFRADPSQWEQTMALDCPVLPMTRKRPNALRSDGPLHTRYRQPTTAGLNTVNQLALQTTVAAIATQLIATLTTPGRTRADLLSDYAQPLAFAVLNTMLGCPEAIGTRVATGIAAMFEAGPAAEDGQVLFEDALADLVTLKRATPARDVTSEMIDHPHDLSDTEMVHQLVTMYAAGIEPLTNLILNTLQLMLTDERFGGNLLAGSLSARDALDETLFVNPPLANFCLSYPRQPILIENFWLPAHQPVIISMAGCNADPEINNGRYQANRSHLAFSAGPHACPANHISYVIAVEAIEQLLDALPDMRLRCPAAELVWRPGPFHRSLVALPVNYPASAPVPHPQPR
ncbi:cytochrome P450 [Nocardia sp. NPDC048505]|uniref:cytochrome P450 n=1 Tax=Nocardia sp. NPDC048505 TaxID=3155756 RepID=UPI0033F561B5